MKNSLGHGHAIEVPAPAEVKSGAGVLINALFGIAHADAAAGEALVINTTGMYSLPKTNAQAWAVGDPVYWDADAGECTTSAAGNWFIGVAVASAANPSETGEVRLNGSMPDAAEA